MRGIAGIDIGGTKLSVTLGRVSHGQISPLAKQRFDTPRGFEPALKALMDSLKALLQMNPDFTLEAIGISCGGPLNAKEGLILSPPNLPGWDAVDVVTPFAKQFSVPVALQNDANACALAEWLWGAGKGVDNLIFLTFGTGMGAGLILNGRLYSGTTDMAGEVGHVRLTGSGPVGFGKAGSFEGYCSGGGIAQYAGALAREWLDGGRATALSDYLNENGTVTAEQVGKAAAQGDALALQIWADTGKRLGQGLAVLIDIMNPSLIIIGSIFIRQEHLLRGPMEAEIRKEALSHSAVACRIVGAGLGEKIGDYAALSVAAVLLKE